MASNTGTLIAAPIRPIDSLDKFPTVFDNEIKGGYHTVDTIVDRNAIYDERRKQGMVCYVKEDNTRYILEGGILNSNWIEDSGSKGEKGDKGDDGSSASIISVSATSLPSGSTPTVIAGGTPQARTFTFGIPDGAKGEAGSDGVSASIISATATLLPSGSNPTVTEGGTPQSRTFTFGIPKGDKGDAGKDGTGVTILGSYETEELLRFNHATGFSGDAYLVEGNLYVWSDTLQDWKNVGEIKGPRGSDGKSAYQIAVDYGFVGTETEWLESIKGDGFGRGVFSVSQEDGNLYFVADDGITNPLSYDENTGNLYYTILED